MQKKEKEKTRKLKYDPAEGLLPEIRRNCGFPKYVPDSPPRGAGKKKKIVEEEWTMPEAQNCGFCSIGGDILCCELCPASFHLACMGIEESDVPEDLFYCNRCKNMPKGVRLFPPEKCCSSTSPTIRIANENRRNWETIKYQYDRLKEEAVNAPSTSKNEQFGPMNEIEALEAAWPDRLMIKALGMANPMDFTLPPEYLKEREYFPHDALEEKRPVLLGIQCCKCELQDEWSPMLKCDFCQLPWHQKCVDTPLINIPRMSYWMCPRHTETLLDSVWTGDQVTKDQRRKVYNKYKGRNDGENVFKRFVRFTWKDRMENVLENMQRKRNKTYYAPEVVSASSDDVPPPTTLLMVNPEVRKSKKGFESRFFDRKFVPFYAEKAEGTTAVVSVPSQKSSKNKRKSLDAPQKLVLDSDEDDERSHRFTDEELIMSVVPYDDTARAEFQTSKLLGFDAEMCAQFYHRHCSMVMRCKQFYSYLSDIELTKMMRRDLDPVETVRGGGTQCIKDYQDKTAKKKLKADVESLIRLVGLGSAHSERRFTSFRTESFFRRCNPPPGPAEALNPGTLREIVMSSQKSALELVKVYHNYPKPTDLQNLVILGYDMVHGSAEARDQYFASSMTIWSKEPIIKIVQNNIAEKWKEEKEEEEEEQEKGEEVKQEVEEEEEEDSTPSVAANPGSFTFEDLVQELGEAIPIPEPIPIPIPIPEPKPEEEEPMDCTEAPNPDPEARGSPDSILTIKEDVDVEMEADEDREVAVVTEKMEQVQVAPKPNFIRGLGSVQDFEIGKIDDLLYDPLFVDRRTKSCNDIFVDAVIWEFARRRLREDVRRGEEHPVFEEHNYAKLEATLNDTDSDEEEKIKLPLQPAQEPLMFSDYGAWVVPFGNVPVTPAASVSSSTSRSTSFSSGKRRNSNFGGVGGKRRGRPPGSRNRRDGDRDTAMVPPPAKRSVTSRGESAAPRRGGRGTRRPGRGGRGRGRGAAAAAKPVDEPTDSTPGCSFVEPAPPVPVESTKKLRKEVEELRQKMVKKMLAQSFQDAKNDYFGTRDEALEHWTRDDWDRLNLRCIEDRKQTLIPYEPRFFLPNQRVHAKLEFPGNHRLPVAIQRCLTKFGTARDCHIRLDWLTSSYCSILADYHCDIVRDYYSDTFYLSTLATDYVIVNGTVIRRPQLTPVELAEQMRFKATPVLPSSLKCRCQAVTDPIIASQENSGRTVRIGIIELPDGANIQIGCAQFTFVKF